MPTLPLIDLMILVAWTSMIVAGVQKLIGLALNSRTALFGLGPFDFVLIASVCLLFALALAARVWVRAHEPAMLRARREGRVRSEVLPDAPSPGQGDGAAASAEVASERAAAGGRG